MVDEKDMPAVVEALRARVEIIVNRGHVTLMTCETFARKGPKFSSGHPCRSCYQVNIPSCWEEDGPEG